jgi:four helix bundle protein
MALESYKDLEVWQMAMTLAQDSYLLTAHFPKDEQYGMSAQVRRASVSIPANIAEGYGRDQAGIAQGSARELETHLIITERLRLAEPQAVAPLQERCERISKMLRSLIRSLEARRTANQKSFYHSPSYHSPSHHC